MELELNLRKFLQENETWYLEPVIDLTRDNPEEESVASSNVEAPQINISDYVSHHINTATEGNTIRTYFHAPKLGKTKAYRRGFIPKPNSDDEDINCEDPYAAIAVKSDSLCGKALGSSPPKKSKIGLSPATEDNIPPPDDEVAVNSIGQSNSREEPAKGSVEPPTSDLQHKLMEAFIGNWSTSLR